jgi:hypothetical protein
MLVYVENHISVVFGLSRQKWYKLWKKLFSFDEEYQMFKFSISIILQFFEKVNTYIVIFKRFSWLSSNSWYLNCIVNGKHSPISFVNTESMILEEKVQFWANYLWQFIADTVYLCKWHNRSQGNIVMKILFSEFTMGHMQWVSPSILEAQTISTTALTALPAIFLARSPHG